MSREPRFARIAAQMADPTRARMLACLLGGEARTAGELARAGGVTPQAATSQLAQLEDAGLTCARRQGRHKYFTLADADVAHVLQAMALVAECDGVATRWQRPGYAALKHARRCYGHLVDELGVAQFKMLLARGLLTEGDSGFTLTDAGIGCHSWGAYFSHARTAGLSLHGLVRAAGAPGRHAGQGAAGALRAERLAAGQPGQPCLAHYGSRRAKLAADRRALSTVT